MIESRVDGFVAHLCAGGSRGSSGFSVSLSNFCLPL
jgi:hypothetical protein